MVTRVGGQLGAFSTISASLDGNFISASLCHYSLLTKPIILDNHFTFKCKHTD